jgi:hypothetical protein
MTAIMARLVLAMLMLPATGAVFLIVLFAITRKAGPPAVSRLLVMWMVVYAFVGIYWMLLWRGVVRWTRRRIGWTIAAAGLAAAAGCAFAVLCMSLNRLLPLQVITLAGGGLVPIVWVLATVVIWRETKGERFERLAKRGAAVSCPVCGYSMVGLREARCPECGAGFTLEQLLAAQPRGEARREEG